MLKSSAFVYVYTATLPFVAADCKPLKALSVAVCADSKRGFEPTPLICILPFMFKVKAVMQLIDAFAEPPVKLIQSPQSNAGFIGISAEKGV